MDIIFQCSFPGIIFYGFYIRNFKMGAYIICVENGAAIFYDKPMPWGRFSP